MSEQEVDEPEVDQTEIGSSSEEDEIINSPDIIDQGTGQGLEWDGCIYIHTVRRICIDFFYQRQS